MTAATTQPTALAALGSADQPPTSPSTTQSDERESDVERAAADVLSGSSIGLQRNGTATMRLGVGCFVGLTHFIVVTGFAAM